MDERDGMLDHDQPEDHLEDTPLPPQRGSRQKKVVTGVIAVGITIILVLSVAARCFFGGKENGDHDSPISPSDTAVILERQLELGVYLETPFCDSVNYEFELEMIQGDSIALNIPTIRGNTIIKVLRRQEKLQLPRRTRVKGEICITSLDAQQALIQIREVVWKRP